MDFLTVETLVGFAAGMVTMSLLDAFVFPRIAATGWGQRWLDRRHLQRPVRADRRHRGDG